MKTYLFNPSDNSQKPEILWDRNYQDRYSDPGNFVTKENKYGWNVIELDRSKAFLIGAGYSKDGKKPFIDEYDLASKKARRQLQLSNTDKLESIVMAINVQKGEYLTSVQGKTDYPNYYIRKY